MTETNETKRPGSGLNPEKVAEIITLVTQHTEPLCLSLGLELVHIEYQREDLGRIMRIYIDKAGGINLDDCVAVNQRLGDILDVVFPNDEIGRYRLEVTSPGTERPLSKIADYERFKGHTAKVRLKETIDNQKNFRGKIMAVNNNVITINTTKGTVDIPFAAITKARLVEEDGEL